MRKLSALLPAFVILALVWSLPAVAQTQSQPQMQMQPQSQMAAGMERPEYMEVYMVKVKPEKRAEFDAVAKKITDANRRNDGDMWIAWEIAYGEPNTIYFASPRMNLADVQNRNEAFRAALRKAYGTGRREEAHGAARCLHHQRAIGVAPHPLGSEQRMERYGRHPRHGWPGALAMDHRSACPAGPHE